MYVIINNYCSKGLLGALRLISKTVFTVKIQNLALRNITATIKKSN